MIKQLCVQIMMMAVLLGSAFAAQLDLGAASGVPGATVSIPVTLTTAGSSISGVSVDIGYNSAVLGTPTAVIGAAATAAGKMLIQSSPSAGVYRVALFSFGVTTIGDGDVATVSFTINPTAMGGAAALSNTPSATGPTGLAVPVTGAAGSISVIADSIAPVTTASPAAGNFIVPVNVALTANEAATIKYTTDGSDPVASATASIYSTPINIAATTTLKYFATDTAGNVEAVKTGLYTIHAADLVASISINGGASVTNATSATLTFSATDATGVVSMRFSNDGVTYSADEPYATSKTWTLSSGDGVKSVYVRLTDGAGILYDPVIDQITLDTTAPVTTATPAAGPFLSAFDVTLSANEPVNSIKYTVDDSDPVTSVTAVAYSVPIHIAASANLKYYAVDLAGNAEVVKTSLYNIHTADLVASVVIDGGAATTNTTAVTLTLSATDATGVVSMRFSNDGVTYSANEPYAASKAWTLTSGDGLKTVYVQFTDGAGLLYAPVVSQINLYTAVRVPVTTASPVAGSFIAPFNVSLTSSIAGSTIKYTIDGSDPVSSATAVTYSTPISISASTTLKYYAIDPDGNVEAVNTGVYTIHTADLVASVSINGGAGITNNTSVILTLSATDATGVVSMRFSNNGISYSADQPYDVSAAWTLSAGDGAKTVYARFTDGAGILYDPVTSQITLDTTAPVTSASPGPGTFIAPQTVTLTANEAGSSIKYTIDGSNPVTSPTAATYSVPLNVAVTTTLNYFATDLAGNTESVKTGIYTIHAADLVASVAINGGAVTTNTTAVTLSLSATDATGVVSMRFSNDGVNYGTDEPYATSKAWSLTAGDGVKTVYVRFTDGAGILYDPVTAVINLSTAAPVTTASPAAGTFSAPVNVVLSSSQAGTIRYTLDSSDPTTSLTVLTYSGPLSIVASTTVKYFATSTAGNAEAVKTGTYTIHAADLVASVSINGGATLTKSSAVTLALSAIDATGVTKMRFSNDGINYSTDENYSTSKSWALSTGDGVKTVYVRFTDGAGVLYDPVTSQITLDTTAPATSASPVAGFYIAPATVTLTASEAGSSIKYTTDGSNPATSATAATYTVPLNIAAATTLKYSATDLAGNVEAAKTGTYTIHAPDLVASVSINGGAITTSSTAVALTLSATDATGVVSMRFSNDGVNYSADEPYATSKAWTLAAGDGVKSVYVRFTDGAGILYDPVTDQITLSASPIPPVTTVSPVAGMYITPVNVVLAATPSGTIKYTLDSSNPVASATAVTYSGPITISATTTLKYFATSTAGAAEAVKTGTYTIHTADLVASVKINNGALVTNNTSVTLTLAATDATGVTKMRFSNDGVSYTADDDYATSKSWNLPSGDGVKSVYVRFTDGAGILYDPVIAQITLDTAVPLTTANPATGMFINALNISLTSSEAGSAIKYTTDGSEPASSATAVTYTGPITVATTTTLKYFSKDLAGNSEAVKTSIYDIHTADLVASVAINGGAVSTNSTAVTLTLSAIDATGVTKMRFSNDGMTYSADENYATSKAWNLTAGNGIKTVYVRFTDGAGLLYDAVVANITLDKPPIADGRITGGPVLTLADSVRALQFAARMVVPTATELARGDVAPIINGVPAPDGVIDSRDALVILMALLGLVSL